MPDAADASTRGCPIARVNASPVTPNEHDPTEDQVNASPVTSNEHDPTEGGASTARPRPSRPPKVPPLLPPPDRHRGGCIRPHDKSGHRLGQQPDYRSNRLGWDVVIGHTQRVYVERGDTVRKGQMFARANDQGAPDGCHLHFEKRAVGGGLSTAVKPRALLALTVKRKR